MDKIDSVQKWFEWRNKAYKKDSVEEMFKHESNKLEWHYTDVLYSFLGIYTIGVWIYAPEHYVNLRRTPYKIFDDKQNIYYFDYLNQHYSKYEKLNEQPELKNFIKKYFSIGNIIPIWPGGNSHRGQSSCFDIPELYFNMNRISAQVLERVYQNACLNEIVNNDMPNNTPDFLDSMNQEAYLNLLKSIVTNINRRENTIKSIL